MAGGEEERAAPGELVAEPPEVGGEVDGEREHRDGALDEDRRRGELGDDEELGIDGRDEGDRAQRAHRATELPVIGVDGHVD